jgi:hypothetical protein
MSNLSNFNTKSYILTLFMSIDVEKFFIQALNSFNKLIFKQIK